MNTFEKQFENLDVQTAVMDDAMNRQAAMSTPPDQVNELLMKIAEEHSLESKLQLPQAGQSSVSVETSAEKKEDTLQARLNALKGI